jgi:hypothetical protein
MPQLHKDPKWRYRPIGQIARPGRDYLSVAGMDRSSIAFKRTLQTSWDGIFLTFPVHQTVTAMKSIISWIPSFLLLCLLISGCRSEEEKLERATRRGNVEYLVSFISKHKDNPLQQSLVLKAIESLFEIDPQNGATLAERLILQSEESSKYSSNLPEYSGVIPWNIKIQLIRHVRHAPVAEIDTNKWTQYYLGLGNYPTKEQIAREVAMLLASRGHQWEVRDMIVQATREASEDKNYRMLRQHMDIYLGIGGIDAAHAGVIVTMLYEHASVDVASLNAEFTRTQAALAEAEKHHGVWTARLSGHFMLRAFMIAQIGEKGLKTAYEIALPHPFLGGFPSEDRAILITEESKFTSKGWINIRVVPDSSVRIKVREEFGGFSQKWPKYREVTDVEMFALDKARLDVLNIQSAVIDAERKYQLGLQERARLESAIDSVVAKFSFRAVEPGQGTRPMPAAPQATGDA